MDISKVLFAASILGLLYIPEAFGYCKESLNLNEIKQTLEDEIRDSYLKSMSYFNIKDILNEVPHKLNISSQKADGQVLLSKIYGDSRCRKRHLPTSSLKQAHERSSCPWYYVMEVDIHREPQTIAKAKCSCKRCLGMSDSRYRSSKSSNCKEISYNMPVIRRTCVGDVYRYGIYLEDVAVGCTCQRSSTMDMK